MARKFKQESPIILTSQVPLKAHARVSARSTPDEPKKYEGLIRIAGMTILITPDLYDEPLHAAHGAGSKFGEMLRELSKEFGMFHGHFDNYEKPEEV
jgi:hypothetical protein